MRPGTQKTVEWLAELDNTPETRQLTREVFETQTGREPTMFTDKHYPVWGWLSPDAALLFKVPSE